MSEACVSASRWQAVVLNRAGAGEAPNQGVRHSPYAKAQAQAQPIGPINTPNVALSGTSRIGQTRAGA